MALQVLLGQPLPAAEAKVEVRRSQAGLFPLAVVVEEPLWGLQSSN